MVLLEGLVVGVLEGCGEFFGCVGCVLAEGDGGELEAAILLVRMEGFEERGD